MLAPGNESIITLIGERYDEERKVVHNSNRCADFELYDNGSVTCLRPRIRVHVAAGARHTFDDGHGMDDGIGLPCDDSFFRRYRNLHRFICTVSDRAKPTT